MRKMRGNEARRAATGGVRGKCREGEGKAREHEAKGGEGNE